MKPELCFFLEVELDVRRTATVHKLSTDAKGRTDQFNKFKETDCYIENNERFWRGPYWGVNESVAYAGIHGWTMKLCESCFPLKGENSEHPKD